MTTFAELAEYAFWAAHTWDTPADPARLRRYYADLAEKARTVAQHSPDGPRTIGTCTISSERAYWLMVAGKFNKLVQEGTGA